jgi:adenosylmethionine-8-amino-7-oxononanoate aminotransferase
VQRVITDEGLLENVRRQGSILKEMLVRSFGEHPHVGDIRGRGLFCAIEIVKDRASKQPFDARFNLHAAIKRHAMAIGLICYPGGGTADGKAGDHVLIAPPFNVTTSNLEQIVSLLLRATQNALDGIEH